MPFGWLEALGARGEASWEEATRQAARELVAMVRRPLVREALLLSNPGLDEVVDGWLDALEADPDGATARKRLRKLWRYAQRFCAKNDTTAFFGPVAAGRLDAEAEVRTWPLRARSRAYVTHWAAQALLDAAGSELALEPDLRPSPGAAEAEVWRLDARGVLRPDAALAPELDGAARLPVGLADPLPALRARLEASQGEGRAAWLGRVDGLAELRDRYAGAPLSERRALLARMEDLVAGATGAAPRRKAGEFYASRTVIHELCDRTGRPAALPPGHAELCGAISPWLELAALPAAADRLAFRAWYDARFGDRARRPWREVALAATEDRTALMLSAPPEVRALRRLARGCCDLLREAIDAHLAGPGADAPLELPPALLEPLLSEARPLLDDAGTAWANPDLMIGQRGDVPYAVFAEAHHLAFPTPCLVSALACREALLGDLRTFLSRLCAPAEPALPISYAHSFISVGEDMGQVDLQLSGLSPLCPERRASFAALQVQRDADGFRFSARTESGRVAAVAPLTRLTGLDRASPAFPVSPPDLGTLLGTGWRFPSSLPRVSLGPLVVHRRRWSLRSARWAGCPTAEASLRALRRLAGDAFPRFTFVSLDSEPKPLCFDRESPLAVELLIRLARDHERLVFHEMLPGPTELWMRGTDGLHTSELRLVFARHPASR